MTNELQQLQFAVNQAQASINALTTSVNESFWHKGDFWLNVIIGLLGLAAGIAGVVYSRKAFREAREAKRAAKAAGTTVKFQSVAIELTEILPKLGTPSDNIRFNTARDLLSDTEQKLHRILSFFENKAPMNEKIGQLFTALGAARTALNQVRPRDPGAEADAPQAVYNAIENHFSTINNLVADLVGIFERETNNVGGEDATS